MEQEISRKQKRKLYKQGLKKLHQEHKPDKCDARRPYNWKKSWGPFIKYDADWDGAYLLDLIIYKLERMYLSLDIYSDEVREDLNKRLKVLKEAIDLGKKIQTFDYSKESHDYSHEHVTHYVLVYKHSDSKVVKEGKIKFETWKNEELLTKIARPKLLPEEEVEHALSTGDWLGLETGRKWAKENGYDLKDIHLATCGEWDDEKNHDTWIKMMKEEHKNLQKDTDKFFKIISRNYAGWWW